MYICYMYIYHNIIYTLLYSYVRDKMAKEQCFFSFSKSNSSVDSINWSTFVVS